MSHFLLHETLEPCIMWC